MIEPVIKVDRMIATFISEYPGTGIQTLSAEFGLLTETAREALNRLVRGGYIRLRGLGYELTGDWTPWAADE